MFQLKSSVPSNVQTLPIPTIDTTKLTGQLSVLQAQGTIDADEVYGEQERALSEFLRLHPMLSLESTSHRTLQLVGDLVEQASIPTRELEVVPKSHDDNFLRPPDTSLGERACCLGERCICVWMAVVWHARAILEAERESFSEEGWLELIHQIIACVYLDA